MIPGHKIDSAVAAQFEAPGQGVGNCTIDWVIKSNGDRTVLLDVKRRTTDFIKHTERIGNELVAPKPDHDPALLFRSVEKKFEPTDPNLRLQGVWIITDIKRRFTKSCG